MPNKSNVNTKLKNIISNLKKSNNLDSPKNKSHLYVTIVFLSLLWICNLLIYLYIINLEKDSCHCSKDWKRTFIKYYSLVVLFFPIILPVMGLIFYSILMTSLKLFKVVNLVFRSVIMILGTFYAVTLVWYYIELSKKDDCNCSNSPKKHLLLYPLVVFVLSLVSAIFLIVVKK